MTKIAVLGAGSWGTALALQLARNPQQQIHLWGHIPDDIRLLQTQRENREFLPGAYFPENLVASASLSDCLKQAAEVLIAVPSHAFSSVLQQIHPLIDEDTTVSWATKGLDPENSELLSVVANRVLGDRSTAVISGPTFAKEVAEGLPTAIVIASSDPQHAERLSAYLKNSAFRPYTSDDMIGVQVAGAAKNIMAIAAGISDGLGYGANSRAALITRGLAEISRLGCTLGANHSTFMGLAGLGDLVLTCTDDQSRNRRLGLALAKNSDIESARKTIGQEVEGINTSREIVSKARELGIEMPITEVTYQVLHKKLPATEAVKRLLGRRTKAENA